MKYNAHHRRSIRLKGWNYSQEGLYYITMCVQDRLHLFGEVKSGQMILNAAGRMVAYWLAELAHKFENINCRECIVMPNHCHFIVENRGETMSPPKPDDSTVGAALCGRPPNPFPPNPDPNLLVNENPGILGEHTHSALCNVTCWFKTMTTNEYIRNVKSAGWPRFFQKLWQRNYYEHIIRDQKEYERIAAYMACNPENWERNALR